MQCEQTRAALLLFRDLARFLCWSHSEKPLEWPFQLADMWDSQANTSWHFHPEGESKHFCILHGAHEAAVQTFDSAVQTHELSMQTRPLDLDAIALRSLHLNGCKRCLWAEALQNWKGSLVGWFAIGRVFDGPSWGHLVSAFKAHPNSEFLLEIELPDPTHAPTPPSFLHFRRPSSPPPPPPPPLHPPETHSALHSQHRTWRWVWQLMAIFQCVTSHLMKALMNGGLVELLSRSSRRSLLKALGMLMP